MTIHVVMVDPPREGLVLPGLVESSPLTATEAAELYAAMVKDTILAVRDSGGDLLINYRPTELLPEQYQTVGDVEPEIRELASHVYDSLEAVRFEVQVGSTFSARVGNTVLHLLREEDAESVAVLDGRAPTIARTDLDTAALQLRRSNAVIAPAPSGNIAYLGMKAPIDFEEAYTPPELETVTNRCLDAGHDVEFLSLHPVIEHESDLVTLHSLIAARKRANRIIPGFTAETLERVGLRVMAEHGSRILTRQ